jgi:hypothetical protein
VQFLAEAPLLAGSGLQHLARATGPVRSPYAVREPTEEAAPQNEAAPYDGRAAGT